MSLEPRRSAAALRRIEQLGRLLDSSFRVPGTDFRTGIDPLLGLVPGLGDVLGALLSAYLVLESWRAGVPRAVLRRMTGNVLAELVVGFVPVLGDVFDFAFKANLRNARLARQALEKLQLAVEPRLAAGREPEEKPLWRQRRALLVVTGGTLLAVFALGYLAGRCVQA